MGDEPEVISGKDDMVHMELTDEIQFFQMEMTKSRKKDQDVKNEKV